MDRMEKKNLPRFLIGAAGSGSGKTTITCGLLQALANRGRRPISFKCGPDYIDPMFHTEVLGISSRNLDLYFVGDTTARSVMAGAAEKSSADIAVIEGVMGYYDGLAAISAEASSFHVASATGTPTVLLVDCKGKSVSILAEIQGFLDYETRAMKQIFGSDTAAMEGAVNRTIRGVILNRLSPMLYPDLKKMIEEQLPVQVLGYFPAMKDCGLESRHLGLVTAAEIGNLREIIDRLAMQAESTVNLDALLRLAEEAEPLERSLLQSEQPPVPSGKKPRIAVARDKAFCFYYQDNLDLLQEMGAELVDFSPLTDKELPAGTDGLYIGGGYPELYLPQLSANLQLLKQIRDAIAGGMPCVAECGGFMYLHQNIRDSEGKTWDMVGAIQGESYPTSSLGRFGYIELTAERDTMLCLAGATIRGHEFHYWDSTHTGESFTARKPLRKRSWPCIIAEGNLFAGYPHLYYRANPEFARGFVEACRINRESAGDPD